MPLNILGITIPENLDSFKVIESGIEKDIEEVFIYGVSCWKKQKYYWIVFSANGGFGNMDTQTIPVGISTNLSPGAFERVGYLFNGWSLNGVNKAYDNAQSVTDIAPAGQTLKLYALWTGITYYVSYHGNGATGGATPQSAHRYDEYKALTPNGYVRTGYHFNGWTNNGSTAVYNDRHNVVNLTSTNKATVTLYALWQGISYYVDYYGNGATGGSTARSQHTYDVAKALTANGYSRAGYKFQGWSANGGAAVQYHNKQSVVNLCNVNQSVFHLYAVWLREDIAYIDDSDTNKKNIGNTALSIDCTDFNYLKFKLKGNISWMWAPSSSNWCFVNCGFKGIREMRAMVASNSGDPDNTSLSTNSEVKNDKWYEFTWDISQISGVQSFSAWVANGPGAERWFLDAKNVVAYNL